ncbi:MAG: Holliday junction resolvase RuvX [Chloroflexi bacterium]|nr:Holliday junction resolvase RuvX [Chloroflexota bacterium]
MIGAALGIDYGARRIGVALSESGLIARRHSVISVGNSNVIDRIVSLVAQTQASEVVVGVPYSLDGSVGQQARATLQFVAQLRRRCPVPVRTHDEAMSTKYGLRTMIAEGVRKKARQQQNDAAAAQYMLQDYLNSSGRGFAFDL